MLTGGLVDQPNVQLVKRQLWDGTAVVGLSDLDDPTVRDRLRALGYVEIWTKPVDVNEVFDGIRRILERRRLAEVTGLSGESDAIREVLVKIEQMAPVSSTSRPRRAATVTGSWPSRSAVLAAQWRRSWRTMPLPRHAGMPARLAARLNSRPDLLVPGGAEGRRLTCCLGESESSFSSFMRSITGSAQDRRVIQPQRRDHADPRDPRSGDGVVAAQRAPGRPTIDCDAAHTMVEP